MMDETNSDTKNIEETESTASVFEPNSTAAEEQIVVPPKPGFKSKLHSVTEKLAPIKGRILSSLNKDTLKRSVQEFDPYASLDWLSRKAQNTGTSHYGPLIVIGLSTFFLADLTALIAEGYIPEPPVIRSSRYGGGATRTRTEGDFSIVFSRNLFNSQGLIPGEEAGPGGPNLDAAPVKTSLPLTLIGILALQDERRSVATIEDKSAGSNVYAVQVDDEVANRFRILQIEPHRVIFINLSGNRKEFVELPEEARGKNPRLVVGGPSTGGAAIEQVSSNNFNVSRSEVDKTLSDLNSVLTQARAIPNFENGAPAGYKLFQIVPGSIYDKLGLKNGDVITGLNGSPINDPGKAFEMLSELKTSNHMELQVKKDGRMTTYTYDIR
jgi:general secretion pathway protein C